MSAECKECQAEVPGEGKRCTYCGMVVLCESCGPFCADCYPYFEQEEKPCPSQK